MKGGETSLFETTSGFRGANRSVIQNSKDHHLASPEKKNDMDHVGGGGNYVAA